MFLPIGAGKQLIFCAAVRRVQQLMFLPFVAHLPEAGDLQTIKFLHLLSWRHC